MKVRFTTEPTPRHWAQFFKYSATECVKSKDWSTAALIPASSSTRAVFAIDEETDEFVSASVCHETDNVAFFGTFYTKADARDSSAGKETFHRMKKLIGKDKVFCVRVPDMYAEFSQIMATVKGRTLLRCNIPCSELHTIFHPLAFGIGRGKAILYDDTLLQPLLHFDKEVTGQDRSTFLEQYTQLEFVYIHCIVESGEVLGYCSIVPTLNSPEGIAENTLPSSISPSHLYRLAPLYACDFQAAVVLVESATKLLLARDPLATVVLMALADTPGHDVLKQVLAPTRFEVEAVTWWSRRIEETIDFQRAFLPHNNSCHFDA